MSLQSGKIPLDYVDASQEELRAILAVPGRTESASGKELAKQETIVKSSEPVSGHGVDAQTGEPLLTMHGNLGTGVPGSSSQQVHSIFCFKV